MLEKENDEITSLLDLVSKDEYDEFINLLDLPEMDEFENDFIEEFNSDRIINNVNEVYNKMDNAVDAYKARLNDSLLSKIIDIENKKEDKRKKSIKYTWFALAGMVIFTSIIILLIIISILYLGMVDKEIIHMLLDFLKYFIGATIVEVIGLLYIITRYLFVDNFARNANLLNGFKDKDKEKNSDSNT